MEVSRNVIQAKTSYTDEELFVLMSFKKDNEEEAKEAFTIFYERYGKLLWSICYSVCSKIATEKEELAKDIFNNVMMIIYEHPNYDAQKGKLSTWMSKIARNEMIDLLNLLKEKRIGKKIFVPLDESISSTISEKEYDDIDTPRKIILDNALKELTEREQEILLTYMLYQKGNKHLPDDILSELSKKYGTTTINLRKIKERAMIKVKAFIAQNSDFLNN